MKGRLLLAIAIAAALFAPSWAALQAAAPSDASSVTPVAIGVKIAGSAVSYGDIIDYDQDHNAYLLSQYPNDPRIYGIAVEDPPLVLAESDADAPVMRQGDVLVNVTVENGPIAAGDAITTSSVPGKGMRASESDTHTVGVALESFAGSGTSTQLAVNGKTVAAGTILVRLDKALGGSGAAASTAEDCTAGTIACRVLAKIDAAPLVTLMRYIIAAIVALGSLYLAFRSFLADAVNGVISVGRNPRAKGTIQAMVFFNAVLAAVIAATGLGAGLVILLVRI